MGKNTDNISSIRKRTREGEKKMKKSNIRSIWTEQIEKPQFRAQEGNKNTDVLIVGGGIAGVLCAYKLKAAGVDCVLAEAKEICSGITENTTAKITFAHGLIYDKLIRKIGEEKARLYLLAEKKALEEYAKLSENIDCDFEKKDSYVYSLTDAKKIEREISALKRLGVDAEFSKAEELPFEVKGAVRVKGQATFHPLKFLYETAKDLPIYENTKIIGFKPGKAVTNNGEINFKKLVVATHFPLLNKHGLYPLKLFQHRSYVIALKNLQTLVGIYVDESDTGMSFRNYGDLLLLGGGGHRTGKRGGSWQELEGFAKKYYPGAEIVAKWATQDCMTLDGSPYIGRYSNATPDVFVATGFNKWGMTNALVSANIITDLILEKKNPYLEVFSPMRSILHPQLFINAFESLFGILTPTVPRCPHLGCALKYNRAEHSWDCPCHGSRFSESGELIDNPATDDKEL